MFYKDGFLGWLWSHDSLNPVWTLWMLDVHKEFGYVRTSLLAQFQTYLTWHFALKLETLDLDDEDSFCFLTFWEFSVNSSLATWTMFESSRYEQHQ